jgi:hypothetical protein
MPRLSTDAFAQYVALGDGRTYEVLAARLGVSKRTIVRNATKSGWQARLQRIDAAAAEKFDENAANETSVVNDRHLRVVRAIQGKALQALQSLSLKSGMDAVRALDLSIRAERLILGKTGGVEDMKLEDLVAAAGREVDRRRELGGFTVFTGVSSAPPPEDPAPRDGSP